MNPYTDIDFAASWRQLQEARHKPDSSEFWDERAHTFDHEKRSPYTGRFVELLGLRADERVFDMGCGTGTIGIELARSGHPVLCADFSPQMIEVARAKVQQVEQEVGHALPFETRVMAWDDDWAAAGVAPKSVDVAYASRSMAVANLSDAIDKLTATACRRCAATVSTNGSPRCCDALLEAAGRPAYGHLDAAFFVDILWQKGFHPELSYIDYGKERSYPSVAAIVDDAAARLKDATPDERARLKSYVSERATPLPDGRWEVREFNIVCWAFIAWNL